MLIDDLTGFKDWWLANRPLNTPSDSLTFFRETHGIALYRQPPYQVEMFIVRPNSSIEPHIHPNVDSYEVYMGGDINFMCEGNWFGDNILGAEIRVLPSSWHGGKFGERGGCFLSVQKWLNGIDPKFVGNDWHDSDNHTTYAN
jgi:hypothetical protein